MTASAYVLKDTQGIYVGSNSISYDKESKNFLYSFSQYLTNGFYTYPTMLSANKDLEKLKDIANKIGFEMGFYIEKINPITIIKQESKIIGVKQIIHRVIENKQAIA